MAWIEKVVLLVQPKKFLGGVATNTNINIDPVTFQPLSNVNSRQEPSR